MGTPAGDRRAWSGHRSAGTVVPAAIPGPVVGGLYCAMFGLIAAVGVQQLAKCDLNSDRNLFIAGFSLFMGLSVPFYFSSVASAERSWWTVCRVRARGSSCCCR